MAEGPSRPASPDGRDTVDFDLHGYVGIRLIDADARDRARVVRQLGPIELPLEREPDITVRFVDRLEHGPLTYVDWQESGFDEQAFYLLAGKGKVKAKTRLPLDQVGGGCEIVCERGLPAVPLLLAIVNMTALGKGLLPLHASAFVYDGHGVLVTGWAKGGKTEALLAFMSRGASYVGDEWVYVTPEGRMFGVPEPIRLWRWHTRQLPGVAAQLHRSETARLDTLAAVAGAANRLTPSRGGGPVGSVLRRAGPVLRRQVNVQVPIERLFGDRRTSSQVPIETVVFMSSHEDPEVRVDPIAGRDVAERMAASLVREREPLLAAYRQFRFAFPERPGDLIERAAEIESRLALKAFGDRPMTWLRHPYPCQIDTLFSPIAALLETGGQSGRDDSR